MKYKNNELREKVDKALAEIQAEHDAVSIGEFSLSLDEVMGWENEESAWTKGKRDYDIFDILSASNYRDFNEANMGSVYKHWLDSKQTSFTMITAYVSTSAKTVALSEKINHDNKVNFSRLKSDLSGYGYFDVLGHSEETVDGKKSVTTEPTLFVSNLPLQKAMILARRYNQWGIIYCGPETKGNVRLFFTSGSNQDIGQFHPGRLAAAYSTVRGQPFVFESLIPKPSGWMAGCSLNRHGTKGVPGIRKEKRYISKTVR
jgi:hypothetical protein